MLAEKQQKLCKETYQTRRKSRGKSWQARRGRIAIARIATTARIRQHERVYGLRGTKNRVSPREQGSKAESRGSQRVPPGTGSLLGTPPRPLALDLARLRGGPPSSGPHSVPWRCASRGRPARPRQSASSLTRVRPAAAAPYHPGSGAKPMGDMPQRKLSDGGSLYSRIPAPRGMPRAPLSGYGSLEGRAPRAHRAPPRPSTNQ